MATYLVFTQFMDTGAILGRMLCEEDIHFVQFWGELSMRQKDKAIETFFQVPEVKVMVRTAGAEGLTNYKQNVRRTNTSIY